jgi:hypothetical protein
MEEEDGTPVYCNMYYFGEAAIPAAAGDLSCADTVSCSNYLAGVRKPIQVPITTFTA